MTDITRPFHSTDVIYRGYTITIEVGYIANESGDDTAAQATVYPNEMGSGASINQFTNRLATTEEDKVENVCQRSKAFINTWESDVEDVRDQMHDGIMHVFTEPAIVEVDE